MSTIYIELQFVMNVGVCFGILCLCGMILGEGFSLWRYGLCVFCAGSAAVLALFPLNAVRLWGYAAVGLSAFLAWKWRGWLALLRRAALLFGVTWMAGGLANLLSAGTFHTLWEWFLLTGTALLLAAMCTGAVYLHRNQRMQRAHCCSLLAENHGRRIKLKGMVDTGNGLTEPLSGLAVMIVTPEAYHQLAEDCAHRTIACHTAVGVGEMRACRIDSIRVYDHGHWRRAGPAYAAESSALSGGVDALIPPAFFD